MYMDRNPIKLHIVSQDIELCPTSSICICTCTCQNCIKIVSKNWYTFHDIHVLYSTCAMYMYDLL